MTDATQQQQERSEKLARRLFALLHATAASPTHVNAVTVLGACKTRPGFLETVTTRVMDSKTVADVVNSSQQVADQLMQFGIFDHVQVLLDRASDSDPLAAPDSINVVYQVQEKKRLFIKTGTEVGNNEGNMNGSITLRNVFGGAETLETAASFGTRNSSAFQLSLSSPVKGSPMNMVDLNAHHVLRNNMMFSSYEELARGGGVRYRTLSKYGLHNLSYDCTWRSIDRVAESASLSIRDQAGHSLKSSISHTFVRDQRDDMLLPSNGHYIRLAQELAGVMGIGNASFFKSELETQYCHQFGGGHLLKDKQDNAIGIHPGAVLSLSFRAGWLANLNDHPKASTVSDRFYLGGPLSVRGFRTSGIGPRDYRDALGGDAYWATGVSAIAPLPGYEHTPVRAHAFVNAGTAVPRKKGDAVENTMRSLVQSPSVSVGLGLIYRHSIARLEINYCIPLTAARGDQVKRGLQLGIGLNFL